MELEEIRDRRKFGKLQTTLKKRKLWSSNLLNLTAVERRPAIFEGRKKFVKRKFAKAENHLERPFWKGRKRPKKNTKQADLERPKKTTKKAENHLESPIRKADSKGRLERPTRKAEKN